MQAQIDVFESLSAIDSELKQLGEELERERGVLGEKRTSLEELDGKLERGRESLQEMERTRGELVQEVRQMSLQVDRSREKLSRCRTEREANAVQRELEELRRIYRDREQEIEKLVGLAEQAREDIEKTTGEREALAKELGDREGEMTTHLSELEQRVAEKNQQREGLVAKLKPQLYRRYEMIRKRRGTAIAHTTDGTCSACHMMLPPMEFQRLMRREDFSQCPSCNRIIYFRPPAEAADNPSSGP